MNKQGCISKYTIFLTFAFFGWFNPLMVFAEIICHYEIIYKKNIYFVLWWNNLSWLRKTMLYFHTLQIGCAVLHVIYSSPFWQNNLHDTVLRILALQLCLLLRPSVGIDFLDYRAGRSERAMDLFTNLMSHTKYTIFV